MPTEPLIVTPASESTIDQELAGLDHLEVHLEKAEPRRLRAWNTFWPKVAAIGLLVGVWQVLVWSHWKKDYQLQPPAKVWDRLVHDLGTAKQWQAVGTTMERAAVGFLLALVVGAIVGVAVTASKHIRSAIGSLLAGLQTMPSIAWFPLAILLLGLTEDAIRFVVIIGAAPAIANGFISGIDSSPPLLRRAGRSMGASRVALYRDFLIPAAMPSLASGLKLGWAFAWRSLMAGELLVVIPKTQSLGSRLEFARDFSDGRGVIASMIIIAVIGILMDSLVFSRLERRVLRTRGLGVHAR